MNIPLQEIRERYNPELVLERIKNELTFDEIERLSEGSGWRWKYFREEDLIQYLHPALGEELFTNAHKPVVEIKGKRYEVDVTFDDRHEPWEAAGKYLILNPTTKELTKSERRSAWYRFFGQPCFIQSEVYPAHNGKPCYHFLTVENGWGDSGNWNIFLAFNENNEPEAAYFEASCC